ncbi:MAG: ParA family protein [Nanoarchaeota archaeon]|nr:ParA family protein [Nanoarchaeota archaeon]
MKQPEDYTNVVSVINMKGGVGKTTLIVNVAWVLSELKHKKILLVDLDPQFNATQYMMVYAEFKDHIEKKLTIVDAFYHPRPSFGPGPSKKKVYPFSTFVSHRYKDDQGGLLDLIPSQLDLSRFVKSPGGAQSKLMEFLAPVKNQYDFVLIDCAPTESILTIAAFVASDYVLVPVTPDPFAIIGFPLMEEAIEDFRKNYADPRKVEIMGAIFTNVDEDNTTARSRQEIRKKANYVFSNEMRYTKYYRHSVMNKVPLYRTPGCKTQFKEELNKIAEEFIERLVVMNAK